MLWGSEAVKVVPQKVPAIEFLITFWIQAEDDPYSKELNNSVAVPSLRLAGRVP